MTTNKTIAYKNGDCRVLIKPDGTKYRTGNNPRLPESVDLKVTDYCDANCAWCHEKSTTRGKHAAPFFICSILNELIPGSEIAIGGGNPLDYPFLKEVIQYARARNIYASVTVNYRHLYQLPNNLTNAGLGISVPLSGNLPNDIYRVYSDNTVFHLIVGLHKPRILTKLRDQFGSPKILLLGYKRFGRGVNIIPQLDEWQRVDFGTNISFDNLAIEQLRLKERIPQKIFDRHFMGKDGSYTMYIDAVRQEYATSSTSQRIPCSTLSLEQMFSDVRQRQANI